MKPSELKTLLAAMIPANENVLITGAPGIGKTDCVKQACEAIGVDLQTTITSVTDPTYPAGFPWPDAKNGRARFLPFGDLSRALESEKPLAWFLDDLGQAPAAVQAAWMHLLLERSIGDFELPDHVTFLAATNRRSDRAGVSGVLEPVKSRFCTIVELEPNLDDWCDWAIGAAVAPELIGFLRFKSDQLLDFKPTADMTNSPCPRTWAAASRVLALDLPRDVELQAMEGAVGAGAAGEFTAFVRMYRDLPDIDESLKTPASCRIPTESSTLYAFTSAVASRTEAKTSKAVLKIAARMFDDGNGEFGTMMVRDAMRYWGKMASTKEFLRLASGPLSHLLHG